MFYTLKFLLKPGITTTLLQQTLKIQKVIRYTDIFKQTFKPKLLYFSVKLKSLIIPNCTE